MYIPECRDLYYKNKCRVKGIKTLFSCAVNVVMRYQHKGQKHMMFIYSVNERGIGLIYQIE